MKQLFFMSLCLLFTFNVTAQGVKIGDTEGIPDGSAMLEIESVSKGLLPPRMTNAQRDAIHEPAAGLFIYNTTTRCYEGFDGITQTWFSLGCYCQGTAPTPANAGVDQNLPCETTTTTLAANTPLIGTGEWTVVSGTATLTDPSSPVSSITDLAVPGTVVLRWTISTDACSSSDDVEIHTSVCSFTCGTSTVTDADSHVYNTILIGNQCWLKENLKTGTLLHPNNAQTNNGIIEKYCQNLNGDEDAACPLGGLYIWNEMMNYASSCNGSGAPPNDKCAAPVQGICPTGWHIPSHYEWTTLEKNVDTDPDPYSFPYNETTIGLRGFDEGNHLKATTSWDTPNSNTNNSGFTLLPAGISEGGFYFSSTYSFLWSSTEYNNTTAWDRQLYYSSAQIRRDVDLKATAFSVRCLKNSQEDAQ